MGSSNSEEASQQLDDEILSHLRNNSSSRSPAHATRKEIQKHLKKTTSSGADNADDADDNNTNNTNSRSKKDIKRALKRLVKRGFLTKNKKMYRLVVASSSSSDSDSSNVDSDDHESSVSHANDDDDDIVVVAVEPIAKRMRQNNQTTMEENDASNVTSEEKVDLDDEIRRLEAELAADSDSDDDDDDDDDGSDDDDDESDEEIDDVCIAAPRKKKISFGANEIREFDDGKDRVKRKSSSTSRDDGNDDPATAVADWGIICLSNSANDRIEPLPQSALPANRRRTLKIDKASNSNNNNNNDDEASDYESKERKKRKRDNGESDGEPHQHKISEGLQSAVRDLLRNYVRPSRIDRPAYYCRVCQHRSSTREEFDAHRATDFHRGAVEEERRRTYCKLCRKQLTSVVQMEEHLKSGPHRDRMDYVKGKQRGGSWQNRGRGGGMTGTKNDSSGRQWC